MPTHRREVCSDQTCIQACVQLTTAGPSMLAMHGGLLILAMHGGLLDMLAMHGGLLMLQGAGPGLTATASHNAFVQVDCGLLFLLFEME